MPANEHSLRITDAYRTQLLALRDRAVTTVASAWAMLDWERLDESFRRFLAVANHSVTLAQTESVRLSSGYLAAFLASETDEAGDVPAPDPADYAGLTRDGRRVAVDLAGALVATKLAIAHKRPQHEALNAGLARAARVTRLNVLDASRVALRDAMVSDERVVGWRRVPSLMACGACLAAATGAIHHDSTLMPTHSACRCHTEPVVRNVRERVQRPTGEEQFRQMSPSEQDRLFAGRGGAAKADLIRTGKASFSDLITTEHGHDSGAWITETPLEALAARAT